MAKLMIGRNIKFAADMGADTVVLHAGRVGFGTFFDRIDTAKLKEVFKAGDHRIDDKKYAKLYARASKRRSARGANRVRQLLRPDRHREAEGGLQDRRSSY